MTVASRISTIALSISMLTGMQAQSPYTLEASRELKLFSIGVGLFATGFILREEIDPYTTDQLGGFDHKAIVGFDRRATYRVSDAAARSSDLVRNIGIALPFTLLIAQRPRSEFGKVAVMMAETYSLVGGLTFFAKNAVQRARPFVYNQSVSIEEKQTIKAQYSFFSGHASIVSGLSFFTAQVFSDYYPESRLKPVVWTVAAVVPGVAACLRVRAGRHFPSDVIAGYVVGAVGGILVPVMHKTNRKSSFGGFQMQANGERLALVYRF